MTGLALWLLLTFSLLTSAAQQSNRSGETGRGGRGREGNILRDLCRSKKRDGRFLFISTKTAYLSTSTMCFVSGTTTLTTCAARRRRILEGGENINKIC